MQMSSHVSVRWEVEWTSKRFLLSLIKMISDMNEWVMIQRTGHSESFIDSSPPVDDQLSWFDFIKIF